MEASNNQNLIPVTIDTNDPVLYNLNFNSVEHSNEFKLFEKLNKLWTNEKFSKELLNYDEETINLVMEKIEKRVNCSIKSIF